MLSYTSETAIGKNVVPSNKPISMSKKEFRSWNERMAREYDPENYHESSNRLVRWIEGRRVKTLLRCLQSKPSHRVLEVGVGAGNILEKVPSKKRTGIDISPFLLQKARRRLGAEAILIEGDAEELSHHIEEGSFDRIFCSEVLEHVQYPDRVIAEMAKAITPDGIAVVSVPNENIINAIKTIFKRLGIFRLLFPQMADHMEDEWHVHVFGRSLLCSLCNEHFQVKRIVAVPFSFLPIRLVAELHPKTSYSGFAPPPKEGDSEFKDFFKKWPRLYSILFALIGPSLLTGLTGKKFVKRFDSNAKILHAGSGTRRLSDNCTNVDIFPFEGVDVVADLVSLTFSDGEFDAVTCEQVLEHVPQPRVVAQEFLRVTRSGGYIHVASPFLFPWHPSPSDYTRWTLEGLCSLFPECTVVEQGVMAGPFSACTAFLAAFFATIFCFGSKKIQYVLQYFFLVIFAPIKFLDVIFAHMPGAELCAANLYVVLRKPE